MPATPVIRSERLDLAWLSPSVLEASLAGRLAEAEAELGARLPEGWPGDERALLRMRLEQLRADPDQGRWLLRAIVLREPARPVIGHIGFHAGPDPDGMVEVGYSIEPARRRRGYAIEAVRALFGWARGDPAVRRFRASVSPDNGPSLALVARLGFVRTGEQMDEIDGLEHVFELPA